MLTHKEFYIWLGGYLHGRLEDEHTPITPIIEKMNEVIGVDPFFPNPTTTVPRFEPVPLPPNPFIPPYEVYCGTNKRDDDSSHPPKTVI
jgi:hypothetical protein